MKKKLLKLSLLIILVFSLAGCASDNNQNTNISGGSDGYQQNSIQSSNPQVKKSTTGICHEIGTTYYSRTKNYIAYSSIADCLASGGRLPLK